MAEFISTIAQSHCYLCHETGEPLYSGLEDRLFGAPGQWNLKKCPDPDCGLLWLDPMPTSEDIAKAYENYFTHTEPPDLASYQGIFGRLKKLYYGSRDAFLAQHFGYPWEKPYSPKYAAALYWFLPRRRQLHYQAIMWLPWTPGGKLLDVGCGNGRFLATVRNKKMIDGR